MRCTEAGSVYGRLRCQLCRVPPSVVGQVLFKAVDYLLVGQQAFPLTVVRHGS